MSEFLRALLLLLALPSTTRFREPIIYWHRGLPAVSALVQTRLALQLGLYAPESRHCATAVLCSEGKFPTWNLSWTHVRPAWRQFLSSHEVLVDLGHGL